jgi:hypothetical protein
VKGSKNLLPREKELLLAFLGHENRWCRRAEALDANGDAVQYDAETAVSWDVTGAMCHLFGWSRACALFAQLDRHLHGKRQSRSWPFRDVEMDAMTALQDFNDRPETTFNILREMLETAPVWRALPGAAG